MNKSSKSARLKQKKINGAVSKKGDVQKIEKEVIN